MSKSTYSHEEIIQAGQFSPEDIKEIVQRRRSHNRLGIAYQLAFVRLANRFPAQQPMEFLPDLLTFVGVQLGIDSKFIQDYAQRQSTIAEHRQAIISYLGIRYFEDAGDQSITEYLFNEACRLEQAGPLLTLPKKASTVNRLRTDTIRRHWLEEQAAVRK